MDRHLAIDPQIVTTNDCVQARSVLARVVDTHTAARPDVMS